MATKAEFQALAEEMRGAFQNIGDDITRLTESLEAGDLSADEEAEVFAEFRALADSAKALAGRTPEPTDNGGDFPSDDQGNP